MTKSKHILLVFFILLIAISCKNKNEHALLESKVLVDTIISKHLNENRLISVYLPKGYSKSKTYPVVYAADGQVIVNFYKQMLDSLIKNQIMPEFVMVGVHSKENKIPGKIFEYRNYEYVKGIANNRDSIYGQLYNNHYKFFTQEVIHHVENNYSVLNNYKGRIFYGTSNGADLGVSIGTETPTLYNNFICFSICKRYDKINWEITDYPIYHLSYGSKEISGINETTEKVDELLSKNQYKHSLTVFEGGHDRKAWRKEFFNILPQILKKINSR